MFPTGSCGGHWFPFGLTVWGGWRSWDLPGGSRSLGWDPATILFLPSSPSLLPVSQEPFSSFTLPQLTVMLWHICQHQMCVVNCELCSLESTEPKAMDSAYVFQRQSLTHQKGLADLELAM